jgi:23S rRNA (cytidine1920-2'-O)/16S rRNA (cytidine1409-2'-O)-methyltransferase
MTRLDVLIVNKNLVKSRSVALDLIKKGLVRINGKISTKPAKDYEDRPDLKIEIIEQPKYVGRGGLKLEEALLEFKIIPVDLICLDVGSSTGGFTDCLLQNGAKKVYAIDVGTGQFDLELAKDPKITLLEQTDIRNIKNLPEKIDLAVIDVSFISLELILEPVKNLLKAGGKIIALIKPQFETKKEAKNKSGIVKTDEIREQVLENIKNYCQKINLKVLAITDSPILGGSGNKEYLILLEKSRIV